MSLLSELPVKCLWCWYETLKDSEQSQQLRIDTIKNLASVDKTLLPGSLDWSHVASNGLPKAKAGLYLHREYHCTKVRLNKTLTKSEDEWCLPEWQMEGITSEVIQ